MENYWILVAILAALEILLPFVISIGTIVLLVILILYAIRVWNKNTPPTITTPAYLVSKRSYVTFPGPGSPKYGTFVPETHYQATFQLPDSGYLLLNITPAMYQNLIDGTHGSITYQENRLISFNPG